MTYIFSNIPSHFLLKKCKALTHRHDHTGTLCLRQVIRIANDSAVLTCIIRGHCGQFEE